MLSTRIDRDDPAEFQGVKVEELSTGNFNSEEQGLYGHGTNCLMILSMLNPKGSLYMAKITDGQGISNLQPFPG